MNRGVLLAAEFRKTEESLFLIGIEFRRHFDLKMNLQIPLAVPLEARHAMAFHPKIASPLGSGGHLHLHRSRKGRHLHLPAQSRNHERHGHPAEKIAPAPGEDRVFSDMDHDVEIANATSASAGLAAPR